MSEDFKLLEEDETKLYKYIVDVSKSDEGASHVSAFEKYLFHESDEIKSASIIALLNVLKIDNDLYRTEALKHASSKEADFDLRQWAISGLAKTYFGKREKDILRLFLLHLNDPDEDEYLKPALFRGLLGIYGVDSREIFLKLGAISKVDDVVFRAFDSEIDEIQSLLKSGV